MTAAHFPRVDLLPCQRKDLVMRFATAQKGVLPYKETERSKVLRRDIARFVAGTILLVDPTGRDREVYRKFALWGTAITGAGISLAQATDELVDVSVESIDGSKFAAESGIDAMSNTIQSWRREMRTNYPEFYQGLSEIVGAGAGFKRKSQLRTPDYRIQAAHTGAATMLHVLNLSGT